ncbi:MAG: hypothetical protein MZU97_06665 [Bacillus subtilis]|nr:hypothetical protein [Bacillus subtilis]
MRLVSIGCCLVASVLLIGLGHASRVQGRCRTMRSSGEKSELFKNQKAARTEPFLNRMTIGLTVVLPS